MTPVLAKLIKKLEELEALNAPILEALDLLVGWRIQEERKLALEREEGGVR